jgi:hypothetical protein
VELVVEVMAALLGLVQTEPLIPVAEAEAVEILEAQILFQAQAALALSLSAT